MNQRVDRRRDGAAFASVVNDAPVRVAAITDTIDEERRHARANDAHRIGLAVEGRDLAVKDRNVLVAGACRIAEDVAAQREQDRGLRCEPRECGFEVPPQRGTPRAEPAHGHQRVQGLRHRDLVVVAGLQVLLNGSGEDPMGGVHVALAIEQQVGGRRRGDERINRRRIAAPRRG
jgi:hypothetical protein